MRKNYSFPTDMDSLKSYLDEFIVRALNDITSNEFGALTSVIYDILEGVLDESIHDFIDATEDPPSFVSEVNA